MYLEHYGLETYPFSITPDPNFFYRSEVHDEGLAHLRYGLVQEKGFVLITGQAGTGKTTLLNLLMQDQPANARVAFISNPKLSVREFFYLVAREFNLGEVQDKARFLVKMAGFLQEAKQEDVNVILIVDEAHCLGKELLEEVRLLSNLETPSGKLMNIILVGQPEIKEALADPSMEALNQRITLRYHLRPLNRDEVIQYIQVRLTKAGAKDASIFTKKAIERIHLYSRGIPRWINILADKAMLTAFVQDRLEIDEGIVDECAEEMELKQGSEGREGAKGPIPVKGDEASSPPSRITDRSIFRIAAVVLIMTAVAAIAWLLAGKDIPFPYPELLDKLLN